jgi:hemoglobin
MSDSLFEKLGGRPTLEKVHKIFYDKIYAHPWIGQFFKDINQKHIEDQQTDFMTETFGGPTVYFGKLPYVAHRHMYITEELITLRAELLKESLIEAQVPEELMQSWLKIDGAFKMGIVKDSLEDCEKRYQSEDIIVIENPLKKAA